MTKEKERVEAWIKVRLMESIAFGFGIGAGLTIWLIVWVILSLKFARGLLEHAF